MASTALLRQKMFRYRNDDGDQLAATWPLDTNIQQPNIQVGAPGRVRFAVEEYAGKSARASSFALICRVNGGTWYPAGDANCALKLFDSVHVVGSPGTTQQLSAPDAFTVGELTDVNSTPSSITIVSNTTCEFETCLELDFDKYGSVYTDNDTLDFGIAFSDMTLLDEYTAVPATAVTPVTQFSKMFLGGQKVNAFNVADTPVQRMYLGEQEVFRNL